MSIHIVGVIGLVLIFIIGTLRPINLGALALVMTFLVGTIFKGEGEDLMRLMVSEDSTIIEQ